MNFTAKISSRAQGFINQKRSQRLERTRENLVKIRAATKHFITPSVSQTLKHYNVYTDEVLIAGTRCTIVFPPKLVVQWPILYGFGGGFVSGSPFEDLTIAAPLAAMLGAKIIIPDYRLAPEHPWPFAIHDAFAVYEYISNKPFALIGESAGGNLALALMLRAKSVGLLLPHAVALLSPWCDLQNTGDSLEFNEGRDPTLSIRDLEMAAKHYAGENAVDVAEISPILGDFDQSFPPFLISTGTRDLLLSQSLKLANILMKENVLVDLHVHDGMWHVFEWDNQLPESLSSLKNISTFFGKNMSSIDTQS